MEPSRDQALSIYRTVDLIRKFEERVAECFAGGEIPGFIHLSVGQEAVPAAVCALLREDDLIAATHRGLGQCLAKGAAPRRVMAELFGRKTGYCRGKGGGTGSLASEGSDSALPPGRCTCPGSRW